MHRAVAASRYLAIAGVVLGLVAAVAAFGWAGVKTVAVVLRLVHGDLDGMAVRFVQIMDALLIAAGLLIFANGIYELDIDALKRKLAGVIVMVMVVAFVEQVEAGGDGLKLVETGGAVAVVSAVLLWLRR